MSTLAVGMNFRPQSYKTPMEKRLNSPAVFPKAPSTVIFFYRGRW